MPRSNTSETVKKQIRFVLKRLLTHVNNESSDQDYDYWEKKLSVRWSKDAKTSTNLIVQTELKVLVNFKYKSQCSQYLTLCQLLL